MFKTLLASQCVEVIIVILPEAVPPVDVITACNNDVKLGETRTVHFQVGMVFKSSSRVEKINKPDRDYSHW